MNPRFPCSQLSTADRHPSGFLERSLGPCRVVGSVLLLGLLSGLLVGCRTVGHIEEVVATEEADRAEAWILAGRDVTVRREVGAFDRIAATDGLSVTVSIAETTTVEIRGDEAHVALIEIEEGEDGWLSFRLVDPRRTEILQATVHVETPVLKGVESYAQAEVSVLGLREGRLDASVSANAELELVGELEALIVEASSGGILDAIHAPASEVEIDASSGAYLEVHARDALRAELSSGATACYEGEDIRAEAQTSSGGSLTRCGPR